MPQNIHIRSTDCTDEILMYAKPEVAKDKKGETLKFHNQVNSAKPIKIKFYLLDEKGEAGNEIPGFCTEMGTTGTVLTIDEKSNADCTLPAAVSSKYYAYTVENADAETLDPVIIIDDAFDIGGGLSPFGFLPLLIAGGVGVLAGVFGVKLLSRKSKEAS